MEFEPFVGTAIPEFDENGTILGLWMDQASWSSPLPSHRAGATTVDSKSVIVPSEELVASVNWPPWPMPLVIEWVPFHWFSAPTP